MAESDTRDSLQVDLVSASKVVWSGEVTSVTARTTDGDVGILRNHAPMLAVLRPSAIEIRTVDNEYWVAAVDGGFLSVANNHVSILAEYAEMSHDIDLEEAKHDLERARTAGADDEQAQERVEAAEARIRAVEKGK